MVAAYYTRAAPNICVRARFHGNFGWPKTVKNGHIKAMPRIVSTLYGVKNAFKCIVNKPGCKIHRNATDVENLLRLNMGQKMTEINTKKSEKMQLYGFIMI